MPWTFLLNSNELRNFCIVKINLPSTNYATSIYKKMKGIIYNHSKYKIEISFFAGFMREPELSPLQLCLENVHRTLQRSVTVCSQLLVTGNTFLNWAH